MKLHRLRTVSHFFLASAFFIGLSPAVLRAGNIPEFKEAELFFEENTTDEDLGLHFNIDGKAWKRVLLFAPDFSVLLNTSVKGNLKEVGLTQVETESAEPGFVELPRQEMLDLYPEGVYLFVGITTDGMFLVNETLLTHQLPQGAILDSPIEDEAVDPTFDLTIRWQSVSDPNPPSNVIEFYEVVVEKDEEDERVRVFSAEMLPTDTTMRVPSEFFEADKQYKVEIISQETSGNRSSIEVPFSTLP